MKLFIVCFAFCISCADPWAGTNLPDFNPQAGLTIQNDVFNAGHPPDTIIITSGSSFGMCFGYCHSEYRFHSWGVEEIRRRGHLSDSVEFPTKYQLLPITQGEYDSLIRSVSFVTLQLLDNRIGCPDCSDGGAEWITIGQGDFHKQILFEYGASIPPIQDLLDNIRKKTRRKK